MGIILYTKTIQRDGAIRNANFELVSFTLRPTRTRYKNVQPCLFALRPSCHFSLADYMYIPIASIYNNMCWFLSLSVLSSVPLCHWPGQSCVNSLTTPRQLAVSLTLSVVAESRCIIVPLCVARCPPHGTAHSCPLPSGGKNTQNVISFFNRKNVYILRKYNIF